MRTWMARPAMALAALALAAAACTPAIAPAATPTMPTGPTAAPTVQATQPGRPTDLLPISPPPTGETPMESLDQILDAVAALAGLPREQLVVVRDEAVTWPDPGLGCPLPGLGYPQVLTEGHWIVIAADSQEFDFRAGSTGGFRLCTLPHDQRSGPVASQ